MYAVIKQVVTSAQHSSTCATQWLVVAITRRRPTTGRRTPCTSLTPRHATPQPPLGTPHPATRSSSCFVWGVISASDCFEGRFLTHVTETWIFRVRERLRGRFLGRVRGKPPSRSKPAQRLAERGGAWSNYLYTLPQGLSQSAATL